ncbi:MAG TPA: DNA-binding response regulator [Bacteroidales bacterium]|nr:DNA-binding response regulator [Bacteroidales bacterium]
MHKNNVYIVDDHEIFRDGLKSIINNEEIGLVIGEAKNGQEFLDKLDLEENIPDIVLMDIDMPIMNGVEATRLAIERYPELKVLALTMFGDESYYYKMVDAGAKGFLLKTSGITDLENAIATVSGGDVFFSSEILHRIISTFNRRTSNNLSAASAAKLTEREHEILKLICNGFTNERIGEELFISPQTVKGHRSKLLEKTGSNNTASLVIYAIKNNIIEL